MINLQDWHGAGAIGPTLGEGAPGVEPLGMPSGMAATPRDSIDLFRRPPSDNVMGNSRIATILSQLVAMVQQLVASMNGQQHFSNATASSVGDPHLAFDGTNGAGQSQHTRFDSMQGHSDLLDSSSFAGGYRISTRVTQPNGNGVTYNRAATIATNFGNTRVSLDASGQARIVSNGQNIEIAYGQAVDLGNGEQVSRNADGSLVIADNDGMGGTIVTRLSTNGAGVDVNVDARNVDLGGDLVRQPSEHAPTRRLHGE